MITIEVLSIGGPIFVAACVGCYAVVANYLDDRETIQRRQQATLGNDSTRKPAASVASVTRPA